MAANAVSGTSLQVPIPMQNRLGITDRTIIPCPGSPAGRGLFARQGGILPETKSLSVMLYITPIEPDLFLDSSDNSKFSRRKPEIQSTERRCPASEVIGRQSIKTICLFR